LIDPFRLCLALGPLAVYILLIGTINLFRRPFLVSGTRDAAALGLALSGLMIVGPIELFCPVAATLRFGSGVWLLLVALYGLGLAFVLLTLRPRLVVYNVAGDELRPVLADVVTRLDAEARWAGESVSMPNLGIQWHIETVTTMRNVSLVATSANQSAQGWRRLELALGAALARLEVPRNPRAVGLLGAGGMLIAAVVLSIARDPQTVAQSIFEILRL